PVMCFSVNNQRPPYRAGSGLTNNLELGLYAAPNIRMAYDGVRQAHLPKTHGVPDHRMFTYPIWSTWARYKKDITQEKVLQFAQEIVHNGFKDASQIE